MRAQPLRGSTAAALLFWLVFLVCLGLIGFMLLRFRGMSGSGSSLSVAQASASATPTPSAAPSPTPTPAATVISLADVAASPASVGGPIGDRLPTSGPGLDASLLGFSLLGGGASWHYLAARQRLRAAWRRVSVL